MKKFLQKTMVAALGVIGLLGCSSEEGEEQMTTLNAVGTNSTTQVADITEADLLGRWELVSMVSVNVPVDLNADGVANTDILTETSCFDNMYFVFDAENNVETNQARLYFDATGYFTCSEKLYNAYYGVSGDNLAVTFTVKGNSYTENRTVVIETEGENDYLKMSLTGVETDAAVYVEDGRQNTVAKDIEKIDFVYVRR